MVGGLGSKEKGPKSCFLLFFSDVVPKSLFEDQTRPASLTKRYSNDMDDSSH